MRNTKESATELGKRVDRLERMLNIIVAIYPDAKTRAEKILREQGILDTGKMTFSQMLAQIAEIIERKEREEYRKLIEASNDNNH